MPQSFIADLVDFAADKEDELLSVFAEQLRDEEEEQSVDFDDYSRWITMLSQDAIEKLGQLLAESFPKFVMDDEEFNYKFFEFLAKSSLSYVYKKLGNQIDSDLAVEISCAIQNNISLTNAKTEN